MTNLYNIWKKAAMVLITMCLAINAFAQDITLNGTVLDENNQPLTGAGVMVKGTTNGEVTDLDGKFTIWLSKKGVDITVSYIGYKTYEFRYAGQDNIIIRLEPDTELLEEIVVVGYGTMKKSDLTGSVASVSSDAIEGYQASSVAGALGGQIAGVQITQTDGTPGASVNINIRGVGTLNGDSSPLFIVDGFQVDNIDWLSNADIESIEVLKDASSAAIYGSRAANGVLMVTTKSGRESKPTISYNGSASYRKISKRLDVLTPYEFVKLQTEVNPDYAKTYFKEGNDEDGVPYKYQSLDDYIGQKGVVWQDETFNPTWSQDHNVSIAGGSSDSQYSALFSHYDEEGIFKNSGFNKTTAKLRFKQKLWKNVTMEATVNYAQTNRRGAGTTADNGRFNMLAQILSARPTGGLKVSDAELLELAIDPEMEEEGESLAQVNPVKQTQSVTNTKRGEMWSGNVSFSWEIIKGLTFRSAATYNNTVTRTNVFYQNGSKEAHRNGKSPYGQSQFNRDVRWVNFNHLTWRQKIKKHSYDVMIGHEVSSKTTEYLQGQAMNFPFDNLENDNLGLGATPSKVASYYAGNSLLSFFARANYNYANRYLFTATMRADGSTVFSAKNKWGYFPSFSAAWRIDKEDFMKNVSWISNLKLRAGWGTVGNDRIANYLSLDLYTPEKYGIGTTMVSVLTPKQLRNSNLKWEGSSTVNLGLDFGFLKDRISLSVDLFDKNTKDLLLAQQLAHATGFSSQMQNIGKIRNRGLEITFNSTNIDRKNFLWQTNFNISFIENKLVSLADGTDYVQARSGFDSNFTANDYIAIVGQSLGLIYGYEWDGLYQADEFNVTPDGQYLLKEGVVDNPAYTNGARPGYVKYVDQTGDGKITTEDRTVIGNALPKWYGGITNTFSFYGVDFSFMFQYNYGNDIYNATRVFATQSRRGRVNMLAEVADRWRPDNANNTVPVYDGYVTNDIYSRFVEDGSFLRLKNVTLGYTLPSKLTKKAKISKVRVYASGQNLFCISSYSGFDPEVSTAGSNPMTPGLDWGAYPKSRIFTVGLDIQF